MLEKACIELSGFFGGVYATSSLYETAAWGLNEQPIFLIEVDRR
jgi:7,8-dihydro-6-hydroxymethylpterin-pyrophosphokinase